MPGIRIGVDVSGGITSLQQFQNVLQSTGATTKLTEAEVAKLEARFKNKLAADEAAKSVNEAAKNIEQLGKAAGLSEGELAKLHTRLNNGTVPQATKDIRDHGDAVSSLSQKVFRVAEAYSTWKISQYATDAAVAAAKYETMGVVLRVLGENLGYTNSQMQGFATGLQKTGISMTESQQSLAKLAAAHIDLSKSAELARVAQDAAVIAGVNSSEAFGRIVQGIATGQTILLHHMGLMVDLEGEYKRGAEAMGLTSNELTKMEKHHIALNAVLEEGKTRQGVYSEAMETAGKQITSFSRYLDDFQVKFGTAFNGTTTAVVKEASLTMKDLQDEISRPESREHLQQLGSLFGVLAHNAMGQAVPALRAVVDVMGELAKAIKDIPPEIWGAIIGGRIAGIPGVVGGMMGGYMARDEVQVEKEQQRIAELQGRLSSGGRSVMLGNMPLFSVGGYSDEERKKMQDEIDRRQKNIEQLQRSIGLGAVAASTSGNVKDSWMVRDIMARNQEGAAYGAQKQADRGDEEAMARLLKPTKDLPQNRLDQINKKFISEQDQLLAYVQRQIGKGGNEGNWWQWWGSITNQKRELYQADVESLFKKGPKESSTVDDTEERLTQQVADKLAQVKAAFGGDGLGSAIAKIDKEFHDFTRQLEKGLAEGKIDIDAFKKAEEDLAQVRTWQVKAAEVDSYVKSLQQAGKYQAEMAKYTYGAQGSQFNAEWNAGAAIYAKELQQAGAGTDRADPKRVAEAESRWQAHQQFLRDEEVRRLGDGGKLSGEYWDAEQRKLNAHLSQVKANVTDETAFRVYAAQQQDKLEKGKLDARIGYETDFGSYLADRLSQDYGLYQSAAGRQTQLWESYYGDLKTLVEGVGNDFKTGVSQSLSDLMVGNTAKAGQDFRDMLDRMRQDFTKFVVDIGMDWAKGKLKGLFSTSDSQGSGAGNGGDDSNYGVMGSQSRIDALAPAIRSYGLTGFVGGNVGAPSLLSQFAGGASGAAMAFISGGSGSSGGSSFWSGSGSPVSAVSGGMADNQSLAVSSLISQGYSPQLAQWLVTYNGSTTAQVTASAAKATQASSGGISSMDMLQQGGSLMKGGSSSIIDSVNAWGYNAMGIGSAPLAADAGTLMADGSIMGPAFQGSAAGATGGLGTALGAGAAAAGIGYMAGGLMSTQSPAASYVGAGAGLVAGGAAALAGYGMLASTGIGALVAIPAAAITALATPATTTTEKNGNNGNMVMAPYGLGTSSGIIGFEGYTKTTTGSFGQTSTSHYSQPTVADPALTKQWNTAMSGQTAGLTSSLNALGMGTGALRDYQFPMAFALNSSVVGQYSYNIASHMAETAIQASDLKDAFNEALRSGEAYIDEINRIASAYAATSAVAQAAGTSLAKLSGSDNVVGQGNWASNVADLMGGNDKLAAAFSVYSGSMSKAAVANNSVNATGAQADTMIGLIGDSSVNRGNFWSSYGTAMQSPMEAADFQAWSNAATWMQQFNVAEKAAGQALMQFNQLQIATLQDQIKTAQSLRVMVDGVNTTVQSAYSTYNGLSNALNSTLQGIQWNSNLSPNTPTQTYEQQLAYWKQLKATVAGEDSSSLTYSADVQKLNSFASTFLQTSKSYYGNSAQYQQDYQEVTGTLQSIKTPIDQEVSLLRDQLQKQNEIVNAAQAQIDQLTLVNNQINLTNTAIEVLGQNTITGFNGLTEQMAGISGVVARLQAAYDINNLGKQLGLPGFAKGGSFVVGENGVEVLTMGSGASGSVTSNKTLQEMTDNTALHKATMDGNRIQATGLSMIHAELQKQTVALRQAARSKGVPARLR